MDVLEALVACIRALVVDRLEATERSLEKVMDSPRIKACLNIEERGIIADALLDVCQGAFDIRERLAVARLPNFEIDPSLLNSFNGGLFLCTINKVR